MDSNIKPGDHLRQVVAPKKGVCGRIMGFFAGMIRFVIGVIGLLIFIGIAYPLWLLFFLPCVGSTIGFHGTRLGNQGKILRIIQGIFGFLGGLVLNIIFIPGMLVLTAILIVAGSILLLFNILKFIITFIYRYISPAAQR